MNGSRFNLQNKTDIVKFRNLIHSYFRDHGRDLPWRKDFNPYHIFVSEIMLQQTQVDRVRGKFERFVEHFPDFHSLRAATMNSIYPLWQGLGYNRRALALKQAADIIVEQFEGVLPDAPEILVKLPGIGPATAASMCAFAYNRPVVFLETNIRTVLIYHFFQNQAAVAEAELLIAAKLTLDTKNPRNWYSALMDYGTMLKKEIGNLSVKSSVFKKQSAFKGSRRELRGGILKFINKNGAADRTDLAGILDRKPQEIDTALNLLIKEGMVREENSRYFLT